MCSDISYPVKESQHWGTVKVIRLYGQGWYERLTSVGGHSLYVVVEWSSGQVGCG